MSSDGAAGRLRVLILVSTAYFPPFPDELAERNRQGLMPRTWPLDLPFDVTFLDQRFLPTTPRWRRHLYRLLPVWLAQTLEASASHHRYDVVFAWHAEAVALPFALLLRLTRRHAPFVALFGWVSPRKKALLLRLARDRFTTVILPPSVQRQFAVERLGVPESSVVDLPWSVDLDFWRATGSRPEELICSAGREMRDYETLLEALDGTGIACHIAGALVRGKDDRWRRRVGETGQSTALPDSVTMGPLTPLEMRELYARSRFVVVPLHATDTDNGISCMMEAWAMGRAVICSEVEGQRDALEPGVNGLFVPVGDVQALRRAILQLWNDPEQASRMGEAGRRYVERVRDLTTFTAGVAEVLSAAAAPARCTTGSAS